MLWLKGSISTFTGKVVFKLGLEVRVGLKRSSGEKDKSKQKEENVDRRRTWEHGILRNDNYLLENSGVRV